MGWGPMWKSASWLGSKINNRGTEGDYTDKNEDLKFLYRSRSLNETWIPANNDLIQNQWPILVSTAVLSIDWLATFRRWFHHAISIGNSNQAWQH